MGNRNWHSRQRECHKQRHEVGECECVLMEPNVLRKCGKDERVLMNQFVSWETVQVR